MNSQLTDIVFILDRSGSMHGLRSDAIGGFNAFVEEQQAVPGEGRMTLVLFDHEYTVVYDGRPLADVPQLTTETYVPRGSTALYDAVGRTIATVGERLSNTPEADRPGTVIVAIMTDGLENASREYSHVRIAEMIKHQTETYSWNFLFLGANMDAPAVAASLNIPQANSSTYVATGAGTRAAYRAVSSTVTSMRVPPKDKK